MRIFASPVGTGSLWFDDLATGDGIPVAYDPVERQFRIDSLLTLAGLVHFAGSQQALDERIERGIAEG